MFARFMDWFDRHKFGVIGTLMVHTFIMLALLMISVDKDAQEELERPMMALELEAPPPPPPEEQARALTGDNKVTNLTSNATATQYERSISRSAMERIDASVEQDLKDFEAAEFQRLDSIRKAQGKEVVIPTLDESKWDPAIYRDKKPEAVKVKGNATVDVFLDGRADLALNIPAYTCRGRGTVNVMIAVTSDGRVEDAAVDPSTSDTNDDCLIENALASARAARFSSSSTAPDPQRGRIQYRFLAQ